MLAEAGSIINEQQAMLGQIEFLQGYSTKWKVTSGLEESDQKELTQLICTTFYLKEGLENLYWKADDLMASNPEFLFANDIKNKHRAIVNSLDRIYSELVNLSSKVLQLNKDYISDKINSLCHLITMLSIQENEILKSHIN
jgi:hypothetical protein